MAKARTEAAWGGPGDVFARLAGDWAIERRVSNGATLIGGARFTRGDPNELVYAEQGVLRLADGQTFKASRAYVFRGRPHGFAVYFAETPEKLFHDIALRWKEDMLAGEGVHPCRDDLYCSRYAFGADGSFTLTHVVKGPRYDYEMDTAYRR
jgi:hypothetical protein